MNVEHNDRVGKKKQDGVFGFEVSTVFQPKEPESKPTQHSNAINEKLTRTVPLQTDVCALTQVLLIWEVGNGSHKLNVVVCCILQFC